MSKTETEVIAEKKEHLTIKDKNQNKEKMSKSNLQEQLQQCNCGH